MDTLTSCLIRSNVFLCSGAQDPAAFTVWLSRPKGCRTPCTACLRSRRSSSGKWICESTDGVFWDSIYVILHFTDELYLYNLLFPIASSSSWSPKRSTSPLCAPVLALTFGPVILDFFELRPTKWRGNAFSRVGSHSSGASDGRKAGTLSFPINPRPKCWFVLQH